MATILVGRGGIGKAIMRDLERKLPGAMNEATRMLAMKVKYAILENTKNQQDFEGVAFPPLSSSYARKKSTGKANLRYKKFSINRIKAKSLQSDKKGAVYAIQFPDRMNDDGEMVPIFAFHEYGTSKMPQRKMLPRYQGSIPKYWEEEILEIINKHLSGV
jgi:hypothetical protein